MSHVNDLQVEDLPGVEPHLIDKLKRTGIKSVLDLAVSVPQELAAVGGGGGTMAAQSQQIQRLYQKRY
jgi:predicted RecB family nuclease